MKETIFNFFLIVENNIIYELGVACHDIEGTDEEKAEFLKNSVEVDSKNITRFRLSENFQLKIGEKEYYALNYLRYQEMQYNGTTACLFENIFTHYNAVETPFYLVTVINDGEVQIDGIFTGDTIPAQFPTRIHETFQKDFFGEYFSRNQFRLGDLIHDDFFQAIKITMNSKLYVSSIKLMMSCIDTIAYLEYGDIPGNFKRWLDEFTDFSSMSINSEELWEFRNSILHMTNLDSRKIINKKVERIRFYISEKNSNHLNKTEDCKYFNYKELYLVVANGIVKWGESYNTNRNKIDLLIERYDRILSDKRYGHVIID